VTLSACCLAPIAVTNGRTSTMLSRSVARRINTPDGQSYWYECSACHCPVEHYHHIADATDGHDSATH
jgi:hypothetical protein